MRMLLLNIKLFFKYTWQKLTKGYSDKEVFDLSYHTAKYMIPRLKEFQKTTIGIPMSVPPQNNTDKAMKEWKRRIGEIIWYLEDYVNDDTTDYKNKKYIKRCEEARQLLAEHFIDLWM